MEEKDIFDLIEIKILEILQALLKRKINTTPKRITTKYNTIIIPFVRKSDKDKKE